MSALSTERELPLDYGVQIRFIKDLQDSGGGLQGRKGKGSSNTLPSKYGVVVRVQGVSGQPYVVLKEGEQGNASEIHVKTQPQNYNSPQVLPRPRPRPVEEKKGAQNTYAALGEANSLRRGLSQDSLLERGAGEAFGGQLGRPPGDGQSGSLGNLEGGLDIEEKGLEPKSMAPNGTERRMRGAPTKLGLNGEIGESHYSTMMSFPEPPPPVNFLEDPTPTIDTNNLTPINKLIRQFDGGCPSSPTSSNSGTLGRLNSESHKRTLSLDTCDNMPEPLVPLSLSFSAPNPYSSPLPHSNSLCLTPRQNSVLVSKRAVHSSPMPASPKKPHSGQLTPTLQADYQATPDIPKDQIQSAEAVSEEEQSKQAIFSILREGTNESDSSLKHKVDLVFEKIQGLKSPYSAIVEKNLKVQLEDCMNKNIQLQGQLDWKREELHQTQSELTQLRMDRETLESRVRVLEDQLAELQEELRGTSLQTELMTIQTELAEASVLRQRQEEILRHRERELTALKGALKDEVASHDHEIEALRDLYSQDIEGLRQSMEHVAQSQQGIESERQRVNATMLSLQQQLEDCRAQGSHWRVQFESSKEDLLSTKQELLQARAEKEAFEQELKEMQEKLAIMKKQIPDLSHSDTLSKELQVFRDKLSKAQLQLERQKCELDQKTEELLSLKKANQGCGEACEEVERLRVILTSAEQDLQAHQGQLSGAQKEILTQRERQQELEETNTRLRERVARLEVQLQSSALLSSEAELVLEEQNRTLRVQLDEARHLAVRLGQERDELSRRLEDRDREREATRRGKTELEEQKRLLDRALEKINKEMEQLTQESQQSVQALQVQQEEYRDRSRKELQEAQRLAKERLNELQRAQTVLKVLQEEVSRLKKELLVCNEMRENALLDKQLLNNRFKHLEDELDTERSSLSERGRTIKGLEDKVKNLEAELDEEKTGTELLNERFARSREQIDQLRSELMQERSLIQDLEVDKNALERQVKDLRSRIENMKGQSRPSAGTAHLESRVQDLEERLRSEEREKNSIHLSQRRLERKLKELNITLDEERHSHSEERDKLALRVKALKRQLDEAEGEVERLEGQRKKTLRDIEEQLEQKAELVAQVSKLETEFKRKALQSRRPTLDSALSSEDEEAFYNPSSVISVLSKEHPLVP